VGKRKDARALFEAFRKICVELGRDFSVAALRLHHASDGDELFAYSTISSE
jgi:hypothetical protein